MDTIPLEMDDIFGDTEDIDDVAPTRLPDLDDMEIDGNLEPMRDSRYDDDDENNEGGDDYTDNPELLAKLKSLKGASKNVQKRTMIKLDATRLTGERGIPVLPKVFEKVKLKGKHHETEDLKAIMHHLEHWGHRLFPKMPFAEVLDRCERLGAKKEVQTCVKKIRLGMPILASDMLEDQDDIQREGDEATVQREGDEATVHREGDEPAEERPVSDNVTNSSSQIPNDDEMDELLSTAAELERESSQSQKEVQGGVGSSQTQNQSNSTTKTSLSEETKAKIKRSKRLAMERRAARLARANNSQTNYSDPPSPSLPAVTSEDLSELHDSSLKESDSAVNDDNEQENSLQIDLMDVMNDEDNTSIKEQEFRSVLDKNDSVVEDDYSEEMEHQNSKNKLSQSNEDEHQGNFSDVENDKDVISSENLVKETTNIKDSALKSSENGERNAMAENEEDTNNETNGGNDCDLENDEKEEESSLSKNNKDEVVNT